jgi:hypothetical protein
MAHGVELVGDGEGLRQRARGDDGLLLVLRRALVRGLCAGRTPSNPTHQPTNPTLDIIVMDARAGSRRFGPVGAPRAHIENAA